MEEQAMEHTMDLDDTVKVLVTANKDKYQFLEKSIKKIRNISDNSAAEFATNWLRDLPDGALFITITLTPSQYKNTVVSQYYNTRNALMRKLMCYCFDFVLSPEITEQGNIHYHGWIMMRNNRRLPHFINDLKKLKIFGFTKIERITAGSKNRILCYIFKEWSETLQFMPSPFFIVEYTPIIS